MNVIQPETQPPVPQGPRDETRVAARLGGTSFRSKSRPWFSAFGLRHFIVTRPSSFVLLPALCALPLTAILAPAQTTNARRPLLRLPLATAAALRAATVPTNLPPEVEAALRVAQAESNALAAGANAAAKSNAPPADLASAWRTLSFDRSSSALLKIVRPQESGGKLTEAERFRLAVLLGDWAYVGRTLKTLPPEDALAAYTKLLESLAANSQSASQVFQQSTPPRGVPVMSPDEEEDNPNPQPPKRPEDKRGLFLSEDFYAVLAAAPTNLTAAHVTPLATLARVAIGPGGKPDFLARLQQGLQGLGGSEPSGHKLAAQLLSALGWITDAGPYLPLQREQWDAADTLTLVLTLEHFTQTGLEKRDERQFKRAAEVCAFMMQTSRFSADDRGLFKQATERFIKLLPALDAADAEQLIRENFLTQPEILVDLVLALGEAGQQAAKGQDLNLRGQSLTTQNILLRVLEGRRSPPPDAVNVLVMNWVGEAEQTYRYGGAPSLNQPLEQDSPFFYYRAFNPNDPRRNVKTLPPQIVLAQAPAPALIRRLNQGLAQRVKLTIVKVNMVDPKEPQTIETLKGYLQEHPGHEKELCQDYLAAWVRKRSVPPEDPNIVRMRALGYTISRQQTGGIPLTRLRQNQNISEFKELLAALRPLAPQPLDATAVVNGFMSIHSGAEVYRLEDIEAIFGPPERMNKDELMFLVGNMRSKLRQQWQDPKEQQDAGANRTEEERKDEVSRGYRTALELVRRGLKPGDAAWKEFIVRGQLFFDASEYEFARQIKLTEYVSLRDEAFGSYRQAAEIYAAKVVDGPRGQWTIEPYQMWFFVMLGASDLAQLTRAAARSDPGLTQIGDAMRALPGPAADEHLRLFGKALGDLLPQVPAQMRQRFLSAGLQVLGDHRAGADAATEALRNYQGLLDEVQLRLALDGPARVGHRQPFGVFLSLEHTKQLARESGGFSKYLQNPAAQQSRGIGLPAGGRGTPNYREDFAKNLHGALDETFEVLTLTFADPGVRALDLPREGWQETPLAYLVLRAKDAAVDRIPSVQLDMDFADNSGQVVLPVRSQVEAIDAKDTNAPPRPCEKLALAFTLDEREWRDGRVVVEVAARGEGVIPAHAELFEFAREGFDVEVRDNGLLVAQLAADARRKYAQADRNWQFTYTRKKDLRGDVVFAFPALKPGLTCTNLEYKHYVDADLVTVDANTARAGITLRRGVNAGLRTGALAGVVAACGLAGWLFLRRRRAHGPKAVEGLALPAQLTPFSLVAFLRRVQREAGPRFDEHARAAIKTQIQEIEAACFSHAGAAGTGPDLEAIARKWLQQAR